MRRGREDTMWLLRARRAVAILGLATAMSVPEGVGAGQAGRSNAHFPAVDLRPTLRPSPLIDLAHGVVIRGTVRDPGTRWVRVRVTDSLGRVAAARVPVQRSAFRCRYPTGFPGVAAPGACVLFVDATTADDFDVSSPGDRQAEATLIVYDGRARRTPDYPSVFTTDLLDARGRRDQASTEWPAMRALLNLYMRSRGAKMAGVGRADFDLARAADMAYYRDSLALYDYAHRDRPWSAPLGHRPARTFWQSVWRTWFNSSNDNPVDGNPANQSPANYVPYAFANDFADILIENQMRRGRAQSSEDNLPTMCAEAAENLLACQHRDPTNFALRDARGHQETYTAGAFRYGMFVDGRFMTEGTGWFHNPAFQDYAAGGVINGRAVWGLGESLKPDRRGALAARLREAVALGVRFCLQDALPLGYAHRTPQGHTYWRDAGEHAYLVLGMLAACAAAPDLVVLRPEGKPPVTLHRACVDALDALVDLEQPHHQWSVYPNVDSMAIAALAEGALALPGEPGARRWRECAARVADAWMAAKVDPAEYRGPAVHFGLRTAPADMTYNWARLAPAAYSAKNYLFLYQDGHWIHALARLYALTGNAAYRRRAEALVGYLCGDNPWGVRLLNETGGVYNWVEDRDGDGIEETMRQDMYPESTAFSLIGIYHLLDAAVGAR